MKDLDNLIAKYLADECSAEEKTVLNHWIDESSRNAEYFRKMQKVWQGSGLETDQFSPDVDSAWKNLLAKIDEKEGIGRDLNPGPSLWQQIVRVAAVIVLGVGLGFAVYQLYFIDSTAKNLVYKTGQGQPPSELALPDGSVVWLSANSSVRYPEKFTGENREVFLEGMGFFEITPDAAKPFIIRSSSATTKVLGTSFNLRAYPDDDQVTVTVVSGVVSLSLPGDPSNEIILNKDEKGVYSEKDNLLSKGPNDDLNFMSWRTGRLTFENATLDEALTQLSEHYQTDIVLANDNPGKCRITATFDNQSMEDVLEVLVEIFNGSHQTRGDTRVLTVESCQ